MDPGKSTQKHHMTTVQRVYVCLFIENKLPSQTWNNRTALLDLRLKLRTEGLLYFPSWTCPAGIYGHKASTGSGHIMLSMWRRDTPLYNLYPIYLCLNRWQVQSSLTINSVKYARTQTHTLDKHTHLFIVPDIAVLMKSFQLERCVSDQRCVSECVAWCPVLEFKEHKDLCASIMFVGTGLQAYVTQGCAMATKLNNAWSQCFFPSQVCICWVPDYWTNHNYYTTQCISAMFNIGSALTLNLLT